MGAGRSKVLMIAGGGVALIVTAAIVFGILLFDINSFKHRIETAASEATGLDFRIDAKMELSFFPFGVSANDVHVTGKEGEILSLENFKIGVELVPLLKKQLKVTRFELVKPAITIVKNADGKYNFGNYEKESAKEWLRAPSSFKELRLSQGALSYLDKKTGEKTELKELNLEITDLSIGDTTGDIIKNISFTGILDCKEVLQNGSRIENLKTPVKAVNGIYNFEPLAIGALIYFDKKAGEKTELKEINLAIKDLSIGDTTGDIIKNISFTGILDCKEILQNDFWIENLKAPVKAVKGIYNFEPLAIGTIVYLNEKMGEKTELKKINLTIKDLSIGDTAGEIIKNISFTGILDCKEILQNDFRIESLKAPVKAVKGIYNFEPLVIGTIVYFAEKAGEKIELKEINLAIKDLSIGDTSGVIINNITFTGILDCKEVRRKDLKIDNVESPIKVEKGVIYLIPLTMDIFGGKGAGDATADKAKVDAVYKINLKVSKLDFANLEESFEAKKVIGGKGDLSASLTIHEKGSRNLLSTMDGTFSLRGDNLITYTVDLDEVLSSYAATQQFNLVDLGAFFIAGPLGTVALKGYRYGDLYNQSRGGRGVITQLISHWKIKDGVADATDCALATRHNRAALKGKLNLASERYDNVTVALLNDKGCATFTQSITGPFGSPQVGAVSAVESLGGPVFNLYKKARGFVQGGKCEAFYNGSVRQP